MKEERLSALLSRFRGLKIAVVGDLFLDRWYRIDPTLDEPSVETGLTAWQVVEKQASAGAAGTVLNNLHALGVGKLYAVGFTGDDGDGWQMRKLLADQGIDTEHVQIVPERMTPCYLKPMFRREGGWEEGNRLDVKNRLRTPAWVEDKLNGSLEALAGTVDAMIVLDQPTETDTGAVTARVRDELAALGEAYPNLLIYADSRARISQFRNVMIKCNHLEVAQAVGEDVPLSEAMARLRAITRRPVIVTLGKDGIAVEDGVVVPAARQAGPIDVCGAGDATTAALVSGLCAGATAAEAAELGNLCAGVTVRKLGTTGTATQEELWALYHEQFEEQV
ncbi:MAG: PfkB family carbohydrate kinase [Eubacteriales bacterium]|nr:PfkB family carbohydrate kinase [Eubacteriales bacterium]